LPTLAIDRYSDPRKCPLFPRQRAEGGGAQARSLPSFHPSPAAAGCQTAVTSISGDQRFLCQPPPLGPHRHGFPEPTAAQREAIAEAARELDRLRSAWLNPPEWTREEVVEFSAARIEAASAALPPEAVVGPAFTPGWGERGGQPAAA